MKRYDVKCPICGAENEGLFLEETNGWMTCEKCHVQTLNMAVFKKVSIKVPVYTFEQLSALVKQGAF